MIPQCDSSQCIHNSLHTKSNTSPFVTRLSIVKAIINTYKSQVPAFSYVGRSINQQIKCVVERPFSETPPNDKVKLQRCVVYTKSDTRTKTVYWHPACRVLLYVDFFFKIFHTKQKALRDWVDQGHIHILDSEKDFSDRSFLHYKCTKFGCVKLKCWHKKNLIPTLKYGLRYF